jgi:hypothetical protein
MKMEVMIYRSQPEQAHPSTRCWPLLHPWRRWGALYSFGIHLYQDRTCDRCGLTVQRQVGVAPNEVVDDDVSI